MSIFCMFVCLFVYLFVWLVGWLVGSSMYLLHAVDLLITDKVKKEINDKYDKWQIVVKK